MDLDHDRSTVTLAGVTFPACLLICLVAADDPDASEWDRSLGDTRLPTRSSVGFMSQPEVYIPTEGRALIRLSDRGDGLLDVSAVTPGCYWSVDYADGAGLWLPTPLTLLTNPTCWMPYERPLPPCGTWEWRQAEPEWVAEVVPRWSELPVYATDPDRPRARAVPLSYELQGALW
jgi:hypothetical protein